MKSKSSVIAYRDQAKCILMDTSSMVSKPEEVHTKSILHTNFASSKGAMSLYIVSPDTDVLILVIKRYPFLCAKTMFVMRTET